MSARTGLTLVNDIHSRLNATMVELVRPRYLDELVSTVSRAREHGMPIITSGSRHAMGGQQFITRGIVVDTRGLNRVLSFDPERGTIEVEAGCEWPHIIGFLQHSPWSIVQKQTGADRLTIGGAVSANIHGRGLKLRPLIRDVESLTLATATGKLVCCSRGQNAELFRHAVGGYGLFGCIYSVTLRLQHRSLLRRRVRLLRADQVIAELHGRAAAGAIYGDWQFAIDPRSDDFLDLGVCSTYELDESRSASTIQRQLSEADWRRLLLLAHTDKSAGFREYSRHYLSTEGQRYCSDTHQLGTYLEGYHDAIDAALGGCRGSEMISELYVPRERLPDFLRSASKHLRDCQANVIYGTVRLIERDTESALPWAREPWACIVFNLHVDHTPAGIARAADQFRGLIDCALAFGGSYYLTYHRWATQNQALAAHPRLPAFIRQKRETDPSGVFQSDWFRRVANL